MSSTNRLLRYTNITALLHILRTQQITLLDPKNWDDSNDSYGMAIYKERMGFKSVLGLCFTETAETYHHWHVFAKDASGVCLTFDKQKLLEHVDRSKGFDFGSVEYKLVKELRNSAPEINTLPFLKRSGYSDECEFRLIYKSSIKETSAKDIKISIDCIQKVTLSPWIPKALVSSIKKTISSIPECERLNKYIFRSTLTGNNEWKDILKAAV